jgi:hypothetical protein
VFDRRNGSRAKLFWWQDFDDDIAVISKRTRFDNFNGGKIRDYMTRFWITDRNSCEPQARNSNRKPARDLLPNDTQARKSNFQRRLQVHL